MGQVDHRGDDGGVLRAVGIGPSKPTSTPRWCNPPTRAALDVHPYTLQDDPDEIRGVTDLGVDGMFANFPAVLDEVLDKNAVGGKHAAMRAAEAHVDCLGS